LDVRDKVDMELERRKGAEGVDETTRLAAGRYANYDGELSLSELLETFFWPRPANGEQGLEDLEKGSSGLTTTGWLI
jgi:hypothetical protein